jgi:hypothetical protein
LTAFSCLLKGTYGIAEGVITRRILKELARDFFLIKE